MRLSILLIFTLLCDSVYSHELSVIPVTAKPISEVLVERRLSANAEVMAANNSQLSAEITAMVNKIHVDIGDQVSAGDLLISLDDVDLNLQVEQAKANTQAGKARLTQAELRLKRAQELKTSQYISADDLLSRETDVMVLRADLMRLKVAEKAALRQAQKTKIKAPFDGVVTSRQAQQGQLLVLGSTVLNMVQVSDKQIHAKIPGHLSDQLANANRMVFIQNNAEIPVELIKLSAVLESQSSMQTARFKPNGEVLVGQTGQLVWFLQGQLLSADLVVKRGGQLGVFIAQDGKAQFKPLPSAQEGRPVAIEDIENWPGPVVIGGRERIQDGQSITVK